MRLGDHPPEMKKDTAGEVRHRPQMEVVVVAVVVVGAAQDHSKSWKGTGVAERKGTEPAVAATFVAGLVVVAVEAMERIVRETVVLAAHLLLPPTEAAAFSEPEQVSCPTFYAMN